MKASRFPMADIKQQIRKKLDRLSDHQQASALRSWVAQSNNSLEALAEILETQPVEKIALDDLEFGTLDDDLNFSPLTEGEMIQQSLVVLEGYRRDRYAVRQEQVEAWVASLGTGNEIPCPR